jgi:hypothetical protein
MTRAPDIPRPAGYPYGLMNDQGPAEQFGEALRAALLAGKFPNPNREGCPDEGLLKKIGAKRGTLPVGYPTHVHVMQCSPCYTLLENYRAHYRRRLRFTAGAAVLLVLAGVYIVYRERLWAHKCPQRSRM